MKTLKTVAKQIKVNFHRLGFYPTEEQTKFLAIIKGQTFEYSCGILAHVDHTALERLKRQYNLWNKSDNSDRILSYIIEGRLKAEKNLDQPHVMRVFEALSRLCNPMGYDFLCCLQSDCMAETCGGFDNFCSEFGYNNDSIKALKIYNACLENARKLRTALGNELYKEFIEASQDEDEGEEAAELVPA